MTQTAKLAKPNDNELKEQSRALLDNLWNSVELDLNSNRATARKINLFQTYYTEGELAFSLEILKKDSELRGLSVGKSKDAQEFIFRKSSEPVSLDAEVLKNLYEKLNRESFLPDTVCANCSFELREHPFLNTFRDEKGSRLKIINARAGCAPGEIVFERGREI